MTRVLAIDYDGTWTADPSLFAILARKAQAGGWRVIVATNRRPSDQVGDVSGLEVVYASGKPKRQAVFEQLGVAVDVWVDDMPVLVDFGQAGLDALARGARP